MRNQATGTAFPLDSDGAVSEGVFLYHCPPRVRLARQAPLVDDEHPHNYVFELPPLSIKPAGSRQKLYSSGRAASQTPQK